jgi:hypothetical protein
MISMRHRLIRLVCLIVGGVTSTFPVIGGARELGNLPNCQSDPHTFISQLVNTREISPIPIRIEADSVNAFGPSSSDALTAFGYKVKAVFGYQPGDGLFKPGHGTKRSEPIYGVVVIASSAEIETRARQAQSPAEIDSVVPFLLTAIICKARPGVTPTNSVRVRPSRDVADLKGSK